jgi:diguanylate cyclase (GGDEF)-like protein/PAS domain S-box-containing protein/putative nucleotidyltransferase with HDIG domain
MESSEKDAQIAEKIKMLKERLHELEELEVRYRQAEEALLKSEFQRRAILDNIPDIAWLKDKESRFIVVNEPFGRACGVQPEDLVGKTDLDIWPRELAERYRADDREVMETGKRKSVEEPLADKEGRVQWIETIKTPIYNEKDEVIGTTGIARDITVRRQAEEKLRELNAEMELRVKVRTAELAKANDDLHKEVKHCQQMQEEISDQERFLSSVFVSIQDGISVLDKEMNIIQANPTLEKYNSHSMPLVGKKCYQAYHLRDKPCENCPTLRTLQTKETAYEVMPKTGKQGEIIGWLDLYTFPLIDQKTGEMTGVIEYARDITEKRAAEAKTEILNKELVKANNRMKQLSLRDSHTGLYNYRYLEEVIEAEFQRAKRYVHHLAVVMLDIDYFRSINDMYGHQFGDLVLKQFARQLKMMVRKYDVVIRCGGEEFIIVSPGIGRAEALTLARRLLDAINLYNFGNAKQTVKLKVSLSVASYPEDGISEGIGLVNLADQIIDKAKESGGNRVYSYLDMNNHKHPVTGKEESSDVKLLKGKLEKLNKKANQNLVESILAFAKTIELKDHYTGEHVENTVHYATDIARSLQLSTEEVELIRQAAMLHDLGKIGISENILLKKAKLSRKEFTEIKKHPQIGADILRPIQVLHELIPFIFYHHERWDGKGYPSGIKGEDIPIGARIIAIADVYQALISDRPYRKAYPKGEAVRIIKAGAGSQFDPRIVNAFMKIIVHKHTSKKS